MGFLHDSTSGHPPLQDATERFQQLLRIYAVLSDPEKYGSELVSNRYP